MKYIPVFIIAVYQSVLSPLTPATCRFYPTCSEYAKQAFIRFGVFRGSIVAFRRLIKCHPFHPGGHDPLPGDAPYEQ